MRKGSRAIESVAGEITTSRNRGGIVKVQARKLKLSGASTIQLRDKDKHVVFSAGLHDCELFIVSFSNAGIVEEILAENDGVPFGDELEDS
jgi:hypothetical protein